MQLKHTVLALAAAGLLSTQAHASEMQVEAATQPAQTVAAFTDADLQALFEASDQPMQLAALSPQEMRETEGAYWLNVAGGFVGGLAGAYSYMTSAALSHQGPHPHNIGWGLTRAIAAGAVTGAIRPVNSIGSAFRSLSLGVASGYGNAFMSNRGWRF